MDNKSPEQGPEIKLSDLRNVHKLSEEIANSLSSEYETSKGTQKPPERRKFLRRIWDKLIPQEQRHKQELTTAIKEGETDPLTNLPNRRALIRAFGEEIALFRRAKYDNKERSSTLLYIDLNKLKQINDGPGGHDEGNKYLQRTALTITEVLRPGDVAARIGGDEFAILLRGMSIVDVKESFWEKRLHPGFLNNGISASVGASPFNPDDVDSTVKYADTAMYEAKKFANIYGENVMKIHGESIR
jgi:diguanylate cyclase